MSIFRRRSDSRGTTEDHGSDMNKGKISIAHLLGFVALLLVIAGGIYAVRWAMKQTPDPARPAAPPDVSQGLRQVISPRLLDVLGSRLGDQPRAPKPDAIVSVLEGSEDVSLPAEEQLQGLSVQTRDTLRLRYNLGLLRFHQGDTAGALAAFRSVLEIDPQGAYGFRSFLQIGMLQMGQGDAISAARHFEKAVALDPQSPLAAHNLGLTYLRLGRLPEAVRLLATAASLDGSNSGILQNLGNAHLAAGNLDDAAAAYQQAISVAPENMEAHFNLGLVRYRQEMLPEAQEALGKAAAGLSGLSSARAYSFLGMTQYKRGFFGEAARSFARAAEMAPEATDYRFNQAVSHAKSGMSTEAATAFRSVLSKMPKDAAAWFGLGGALYADGRKAEALEAYRNGVTWDSTATGPIFTMGFIHFEQGRLAEASENFRRVIALGGPDAPRAHVNLGLCYEAEGKWAEAVKEYEAGDAADPRTHYNLGLVRRRLGNLTGAVEAFQRATEMRPGEARYAAALGDAYVEAQMPEAALGAYEKAVRSGGENFEIVVRLAQISTKLEKLTAARQWVDRSLATAHTPAEKARAHLAEGLLHDRRGDLDAALRSFRSASVEDRTNSDAYYNLGILLARLRSYDEAVDALRVAVRLKPDHAPAHTQLGNIFAARGLSEEAAEEYQAAVRIDSAAVEAAFNLKEIRARETAGTP